MTTQEIIEVLLQTRGTKEEINLSTQCGNNLWVWSACVLISIYKDAVRLGNSVFVVIMINLKL